MRQPLTDAGQGWIGAILTGGMLALIVIGLYSIAVTGLLVAP